MKSVPGIGWHPLREDCFRRDRSLLLVLGRAASAEAYRQRLRQEQPVRKGDYRDKWLALRLSVNELTIYHQTRAKIGDRKHVSRDRPELFVTTRHDRADSRVLDDAMR